MSVYRQWCYPRPVELCAVFETWHLGDGNYPAFKTGMPVNLSFEIQPTELTKAPHWTPPHLHHTGGGEYNFVGQVLRVYTTGGIALAVIETGEFRFYIYSKKAASLAQGDAVSGRGTLVLDHYIWVEYLRTYPDPPDLFYSLSVDRIQRIQTPQRLITRGNNLLTYPTHVAPSEYTPEDAQDVDAITDDGIAHYVVHFTDRDLPSTPLRPTFLGWRDA